MTKDSGHAKPAQDYQSFLASKTPKPLATGCDPLPIPARAFDFQAACAEFAIRQGRAGIYLDTGLGKSAIQAIWAHNAARATNGRSLILTPLAVAQQMRRECEAFGYDARVIREQSEAGSGINICNYDRLDKIDADEFGGVSLDEASVLKSIASKTRATLTRMFRLHRFKLCATATPAPNDHMELGQQADFLGVMSSNEMLSRFFINDTSTASQKWRLKGHAHEPFWDWLASWSRMASSPDDLGYDGSRYILPPLNVVRHQTVGNAKVVSDGLFADMVSATSMHSVKRETVEARAELAAEIVLKEPNEAWIVWCDTDYEADAIKARLPAAIEVRGSHSIEKKEASIEAFLAGDVLCMITKPSIMGYGLNLQHCARAMFVGRTFSYEAWYQAVRRNWRFGQSRQVDAHLIVAEGEDQIGRVIDRKSDDHDRMKVEMTKAMRRAMGKSSARMVGYNPTHIMELPSWLKSVA
jgi:hypothetical protein